MPGEARREQRTGTAAAMLCAVSLLASCTFVPEGPLPPVREGSGGRAEPTATTPAPQPGSRPTPDPGGVTPAPRPSDVAPSPLPPDATTRTPGATGGAGASPTPPPAGAPRAPLRPEGGAAVVELIERAQADQEAGALARAAATLERALKIEPRNPLLWFRLASVRRRQGRDEEAEALAMRSLSFISGKRELAARNWELIAAVRGARGDQAGAAKAGQEAEAARAP